MDQRPLPNARDSLQLPVRPGAQDQSAESGPDLVPAAQFLQSARVEADLDETCPVGESEWEFVDVHLLGDGTGVEGSREDSPVWVGW